MDSVKVVWLICIWLILVAINFRLGEIIKLLGA